MGLETAGVLSHLRVVFVCGLYTSCLSYRILFQCECGDESSCSIKDGKFLDKLRGYQCLKADYRPTELVTFSSAGASHWPHPPHRLSFIPVTFGAREASQRATRHTTYFKLFISEVGAG
jgi:hypothetical protein